MGSVEEAWCEGGSCISSSARQVSRMSTEGEAAPAAEAPAEGEPLPEEASGLPPACMDLTDFLLKVDEFDKIDALDEKAERLENCPNYRQVNGFPIYGTGQPSEAGFQKVLEKVSTAAGEGVNKMIWFNMPRSRLSMSMESRMPPDPQMTSTVTSTSTSANRSWMIWRLCTPTSSRREVQQTRAKSRR